MAGVFKKTLLIMTVVSVIVYGIYAYFTLSGINHHSTYYEEKVELFSKLSSQRFAIVFAGDSLTDNANWAELLPEFITANRGIQGDISINLLNRVETVTSTEADIVFLMIGINDIRRGVSSDEVVSHIDALLQKLENIHEKIFIQSVILTNYQYQTFNSKVLELNKSLALLAGQYKKVSYIDLNLVLAHEGKLDERYTYDGLHLNGSGYLVWRDYIRGFIKLG